MLDASKLGHMLHSAGSHGSHNAHHHHHHTMDSTKNDHPKSPPSDCQKNGPFSKWLPKQKRPERKSPTSDNQKKESPCKDSPSSSKDLPNGWKQERRRRSSKLIASNVSNPNSCPCASLQHFILTVPLMFPPTNDKVELHKYFNKWKTVDSEAFTGVDGDERTKLLLQGKLCSFFNVCLLHHLMFIPNLLILLFVSSYAVVYF